MVELEKHLSKSDRSLWNDYIHNNSKGLKKQANKLLDQLIENLRLYSEDQLNEVVMILCELHENHNLKINHKLFSEIMYPNLVSNALKMKPDYYRLLALFEQRFHSDKKLTEEVINKLNLSENYFDALEVLERELSLKQNHKAAKLLVLKLAWHLDYAVHELPIGLIYPADMIKQILNRLIEVLNDYNLGNDKWNESINFVEAAICEWEKYSNSKYGDFKEYLRDQNSVNSNILLSWDKAIFNEIE